MTTPADSTAAQGSDATNGEDSGIDLQVASHLLAGSEACEDGASQESLAEREAAARAQLQADLLTRFVDEIALHNG